MHFCNSSYCNKEFWLLLKRESLIKILREGHGSLDFDQKHGGGGGGLVAKSFATPATPWTVARQAPLSMGFSRQEYWSGLLIPSPCTKVEVILSPKFMKMPYYFPHNW